MMRHLLNRGSQTVSSSKARAWKVDTPFLIGVALIIFGFVGADRVIGRQTVQVTLTHIDSPRSCRERSTLFVAMRQRSEAPHSEFDYCGIVITDHGSFILPETNRLLPLFGFPSREALYDVLHEGCRFELTVSGGSPPLKFGGPARNKGNKTLRRATPIGDCPASSTP